MTEAAIHLPVATFTANKLARFISIAAIITAGSWHLLIVPAHSSHATAHMALFALLGVTQLVWALAFWKHASTNLHLAGFAVSGGPIVLWALTRVSTPFAPSPDVIDISLVAIIFIELTSFFALMALAMKDRRALVTRWLLTGVFAALVFGAGGWGAGHLGEMMYPTLGSAEGPHFVHEHSAAEQATRDVGRIRDESPASPSQ